MVKRISFIDLDTNDMELNLNPLYIKAYVIGTSCSGKTSFIKRMLFNTFTFYYTETRAIEIYKPKQFKQKCLTNSFRPLINVEFWDIPPNQHITNTETNDILIIIYKDKMPCIPSIPIRTWILYRDDKPKGFSTKKIKINNLENTGIEDFKISFLNEFTKEYH